MTRLTQADQLTHAVVTTVKSAVPKKTRISPASPSDPSDDDGVDIFLLNVAPRPMPRTTARTTSVLLIDYLILVRNADQFVEHQMLGDIAFATLAHDQFELPEGRSPADACLSLGLSPRSALLVRGEVARVEPLPAAPPVREAVVELDPVRRANGRVVGPNSKPVRGATVTLVGTKRSVVTDKDGNFAFSITGDGEQRVTARARGWSGEGRVGQEAMATVSLEEEK